MILIYLGHPAHYHLFKHLIRHFQSEALVVIKSKDVLEQLLQEEGVPYLKVEDFTTKSNTGSKFRLLLRIMKRVRKIVGIIKKHKPLALFGSPAELALCGKLTGLPTYMFFEDDVEKVSPYGMLTGPLATGMVCPDVCSAGRWNKKKISYHSYHELAYLHPDHFVPSPSHVAGIFRENEKNFIIRFVDLGAFHDKGKKGISDELARKLIEILRLHGNIFITSERKLTEEFEPYRIHVPASDMHHLLAFADLFIGDSQTMTAEAAVLGTPALRFNDFAGELSYLEELEHRYQLTFGFKTSQEDQLLSKLLVLLNTPELRNEWTRRKNKMLHEKINLAKWMIEFAEIYR